MAAEPTIVAAVGGFIFTNLPRPWLVPVVLALAVTAGVWAWRRYGPSPIHRMSYKPVREAVITR